MQLHHLLGPNISDSGICASFEINAEVPVARGLSVVIVCSTPSRGLLSGELMKQAKQLQMDEGSKKHKVEKWIALQGKLDTRTINSQSQLKQQLGTHPVRENIKGRIIETELSAR